MTVPLKCSCPKMKVVNQGWFPWSDHLTAVLIAICETTDPDGNPLMFPLTFGQCVVKRTTDPDTIMAVRNTYAHLDPPIPPVRAVWMVEALVATCRPGDRSKGSTVSIDGKMIPSVAKIQFATDVTCDISIPQEPTIRSPDGNIDVLPITSTAGRIVLADGRVGDVTLTLARTVGRPDGMFGLWSYTVASTVCPGQILWRS